MGTFRRAAVGTGAVLLAAVLSSCNGGKSGSTDPIAAVIGKRGAGGVPVVALSQQMSVVDEGHVEGVLHWDGAAIVRRADGYFRIDPVLAEARPLRIDGLAKISDLAEAGGKFYALGTPAGSTRPILVARQDRKWERVEIPADLRIAAGLWLAGGPEGLLLVTPFEAYRRDKGKWRDYRFTGANLRYREGTKFHVKSRIFSATRLGITGGELRTVDLATTPRVWKSARLPAHYRLTSLAVDEKGVVWAGANRIANGMNRAVLFRESSGELKPVTGVVFGEQEKSWPSLLGILSDPQRGELLVLLSTGVARLAPARSGPKEPRFVARFDFPADLFFDFARDGAGNLYLATEFAGIYQLRLLPAGDSELRRITITR